MKYIGVVVSLFMGMPIAHSEEPEPRHYYRAKLEPVAHVLHGAGQCSSQDVVDYAKTLESYDPAIFMDYCGVKNAGTNFANNLKKKLDEFPKYTVVQMGLSMTRDGKPEEHYEHDVAEGNYDEDLAVLLNSLKQLDVPLYIRIGYECNGRWNGYQPETYKKAFRHVTQMIRESGINAATVWCPHPNNLKQAMKYYPGDRWVDWWAVDIFSPDQIHNSKPLIAEAHKHGKPVMIGESTPRHVGVLEGKTSWDKWFGPYFELIRKSPGIKAFCYINWNWAKYPRWQNWGDARLQQNEVVADLYKKEMSLPLYQHASTKQAFHSSQLATGELKAPDKAYAGDGK
jgi:hypothetical protein